MSDRRELRFGRMSDIRSDVETLAAADAIRSTGNWTPGQNLQHITKFIAASLDGYGFRMGLPMRLLGRMVKSNALNRPIKPGFKLRGRMQAFEPDADTSWDAALATFRAEMDRLEGGARMTAESPIFGLLVHEEWQQLHCRHAELHLGFLYAVNGADG